MTQDQVFVPSTRSELGLKPLDPAREELLGSRVTDEVKREMWEALGDSPIGAALGSASYLVRYAPQQIENKTSYRSRVARRLVDLPHHQCIWPKEIPQRHQPYVHRFPVLNHIVHDYTRLQP